MKKIFEEELRDEKKRNVTLSFQFRQSLENLMKALNACQPFFVRCIKPNENKRPQVIHSVLYINKTLIVFFFQEFDKALCCRQLRYSGMMETAKIRQAGYPIRHEYSNFTNRFRYLAPNIPPAHKTDCKEAAKKICQTVFKNGQDYQLGLTKVFLKDADNEYLEQERTKILAKYIIVLQKNIKGWIYRRRYKKMKTAALTIQKYWRARGHRSKFLTIRNGYYRLQARILSRQAANNYSKIKKSVVKLQKYAKGYLARKKKLFGKIYALVKQRKEIEAKLKKEGVKNYKAEAEKRLKASLAELDREYKLKEIQPQENDRVNKLVDDVFEFLKDTEAAPEDKRQSQSFMVRIEDKIFGVYI